MSNFIKTALIYLAASAVLFGFSFLFGYLVGAMQNRLERIKSTVALNLLLPVNFLLSFLLLFFVWGRYIILPMIFFGFNGHIITWYCSIAIAALFVYGTIGAGEFWSVNYYDINIRWYGVALQIPVSFALLNGPVYISIRTFFDVQYGMDGWPLYVCTVVGLLLNIFLIVYYSIQFYKLYQKSHVYA